MSHSIRTLVLLLLWSAPSSGAETPSEYQVKAAFLYKFARFVEWPTASFADPTSPLIICILGEDPFGPMLDQAVAGKLVQGRPLQILRLARLDQPPPCHILYLSYSSGPELARALALLGNHRVLTVGDTEGFTRAGGMIRLLVNKQNIFFEINAEAAQRAGLSISSQLLKLARARTGGR